VLAEETLHPGALGDADLGHLANKEARRESTCFGGSLAHSMNRAPCGHPMRNVPLYA
jgi:hypothetical protein